MSTPLLAPQLSAAIDALRAVLPMHRPADAVLADYFHLHRKMGREDRHFIAETVFSVLRRYQFLSHLCGTERPTPRNLVLASLVRIKGLNLRQLAQCELKEAEEKWLKEVKSATTEGMTLAQQAELPEWVVSRLQESGMTDEAILTLGRTFQHPAPLDIRVNSLLTDRNSVLATLAAQGIEAEEMAYSPWGLRFKKKQALQKMPLFTEGKIEVQDEGSQLLGLLLAPRRGEMVADFCAGAGGKTLLLGAMMASQGRLYAFDVSEKRLSKFKPRLKRSGLSNVNPQVIQNENDSRIKRLAGKLDRVLVDAPCSGLGTLRRNPDLKWRQSPDSVEELTQKQASILQAASGLVKKGGRLVYATCSILPQENEAIVTAFLEKNPHFSLMPAHEILKTQRVPLNTGEYLKLSPAQQGTDGFFAAVFERATSINTGETP